MLAPSAEFQFAAHDLLEALGQFLSERLIRHALVAPSNRDRDQLVVFVGKNTALQQRLQLGVFGLRDLGFDGLGVAMGGGGGWRRLTVAGADLSGSGRRPAAARGRRGAAEASADCGPSAK